MSLTILLTVLGVSAILIALSILILGAGATAAAGEQGFDMITGWRGPASPPWPATMDSELRFYAALWLAYGVAVSATAGTLDTHADLVPWLAAILFLGGLGRAISWASVGPPHAFFLTLMVIELLWAPVLMLLWAGMKTGAGLPSRLK